MKKWLVGGTLGVLAVGVRLAAGTATASPRSAQLTKVTLQLKWVPQAQFAGYYAASLKGFYKAQGLDVTLKNGGPNIIPETVVASGQRSSASTGCRACSRRVTATPARQHRAGLRPARG